MTTSSLVSRALLLLGCALASSSAFSIGSYSFQRLPDLGFGGQALGIGDGPLGGVMDFNDMVVGYVNNGIGGSTATAWKRSGGVWGATYLPGQGGANSMAYQSWLDETSLGTVSLIVGEAQDGSGTDNANMWISVGGSAYVRYSLPTLGGASGKAVSVVRGKDPLNFEVIIVGTTQTTNGSFHATLWQVKTGFPIATYDLGTLGGVNSEVVSVHDDGEIFSPAGRSQAPNGSWRACSWRIPYQAGSGSPQIVDRHPGGIASWWSDATGHFDFVTACGGAITASGKSIAGFADISSANGAFVPLTARGATDTDATTIARTRDGNIVFGQAWNDPNNRLSVVWNAIASSGATSVYPLGAIGEGASDVNAFMRASTSLRAVGSYFDNVSGHESACALTATGTQRPDTVTDSFDSSESRFNQTDLWRANDEKTVRLRPRQGSTSSLECKWEGPDLDATKNIVANVRARVSGGAPASAQGVVEIYNFQTSLWDLVGTKSFFDVWTDMVVSAPATAHFHPQTGQIRVRATFTALTGRARGVEVDSFTISTHSPL